MDLNTTIKINGGDIPCSYDGNLVGLYDVMMAFSGLSRERVVAIKGNQAKKDKKNIFGCEIFAAKIRGALSPAIKISDVGLVEKVMKKPGPNVILSEQMADSLVLGTKSIDASLHLTEKLPFESESVEKSELRATPLLGNGTRLVSLYDVIMCLTGCGIKGANSKFTRERQLSETCSATHSFCGVSVHIGKSEKTKNNWQDTPCILDSDIATVSACINNSIQFKSDGCHNLTEKFVFPASFLNKKGSAIENPVLRATPILEDGTRLVSLYDVIMCLTGCGDRGATSRFNRDKNVVGTELTFCGAKIHIGISQRHDTPCILASDIMTVATHLNKSVQALAGSTLTRAVGGDITLADEVIENREIQNILAEEDPRNALRLFGEAVESESVKTIAGETPRLRQDVLKNARGKIVRGVNFIKDSQIPEADIKAAIRDLRRGDVRNCLYVIHFSCPAFVQKVVIESIRERNAGLIGSTERTIVTRNNAPFGFVKIGFTDNPSRRFDELLRELALYTAVGFEPTLLRCEDLSGLACRVEQSLFRTLRADKIMPNPSEAIILARCSPGRNSADVSFSPYPYNEVVLLTETFKIPELDALIDKCKSRIGATSYDTNELSPTHLFEIELEKIRADKIVRLFELIPECDRLYAVEYFMNQN